MNLELVRRGVLRFQDDFESLAAALEREIIGQENVIRDLMVALLAGGHVLLEGAPGLGKTQLAKALAQTIGISFSRIQGTPDLMPSDITGSEILLEGDADADRHLVFRAGPIFSSLVLVDEINRAPPKTQAALLEAMQEGQVTHGGKIHRLPSPFWTIATQNTIELEGTYPLPEAQLDRFFSKIVIPYPTRDSLIALAEATLDRNVGETVQAALEPERILEMMAQVREVIIADPVKRAAADLIVATHSTSAGERGNAAAHILYGASPRALQSLLRAARVRALADGRVHVAIEDLHVSALPVLRHRVFLRTSSIIDDVQTDYVLGEIIAQWLDLHSNMKF